MKIATIRVLIAFASIHSLIVHQMNMKTAFLNGDLDEEIHMEQPEGFVVLEQEYKVCKLIKSLYGLKQASKQLYEKLIAQLQHKALRQVKVMIACILSMFLMVVLL